MSVRKRTWRNADGSQGEAWVAAYTDHTGKRRIRSFEKKQEAVAYHASVSTELRSGTHVPNSQSLTVAEAGRLWLAGCEAAGLERGTRTAKIDPKRLDQPQRYFLRKTAIVGFGSWIAVGMPIAGHPPGRRRRSPTSGSHRT